MYCDGLVSYGSRFSALLFGLRRYSFISTKLSSSLMLSTIIKSILLMLIKSVFRTLYFFKSDSTFLFLPRSAAEHAANG